MDSAAESRTSPIEAPRRSPWRVRPSLLYALGVSLLAHLAWSLWPVEPADAPDATVLTATLEQMPPPPVPAAEPAPKPQRAAAKPRPRPTIPRSETPPPVTAPDSAVAVDEPAPPSEAPAASARDTAAPQAATAAQAPVAAPEPAAAREVVLPPRLDLAYKVFLGTQGFMIGEATYRFEHTGDRYRISTVGQARGLAALIVRGTGKVESRGRITPAGLKPFEFAIERGSADRREVAFFDWDAGNVVLHDGATAQLEAPAFDPLTILWQPYFSPPGREDQTFSLATTRKVARYTLTLEAEEAIAWPRGEVLTERWHRVSDDGKTEAWFWLAPSMHYIPIKMRVTRTARGTLEVLLDSIRTDAADAAAPDAVEPPRPEESAAFPPWNPREPLPGPDSKGQ
ncbi:MAG TPA: DUF3108 domain-containing protein [Casimicrobiaceae bacterium]